MTTLEQQHRPPKLDLTRHLMGRVRGAEPGPTLLMLAGIHGNEPAGVRALRNLLDWLERERPPLRGELVAIAGNLEALRQGVRFIDHDLNRCWTRRRVARLRGADESVCAAAEDREQRELLTLIHELLAASHQEVYFLDLHTASARGAPFVTVGDTLRNREFARRFPLPLILGLEEQVDGALLEYLNNEGLVTMGVEGGQHDDPVSVAQIETVIRLALVVAGLLSRERMPGFVRLRRRLIEAARGAPRVIEVRYRHAIAPRDGFQMNVGFSNFSAVRKGQAVARDAKGEIHAPEDGLILLPLYQGLGNDGFFLSREFKPLWLTVSKTLRRLRFGGLAPFLPGVRRHPEWADTLVVNTRVARFFPLQVLHLLGYRKLRQHGAYLLVNRRRFDLHPPVRPEAGS